MAIRFSCPFCGKAFAGMDEQAGMRTKCPACGRGVVIPPVPAPPPLPAPMAARTRPRSYLDWFGWIGIAIATTIAASGVLWLGGPPWNRPEETEDAAGVGDAVLLRLPDAEPHDLRGVWLARTDSSWNEMHDARRLRDAGKLNLLAARGLTFRTGNRTRGIVVGANFSALQVRLLDGPHTGNVGWVDRGHVARDSNLGKH